MIAVGGYAMKLRRRKWLTLLLAMSVFHAAPGYAGEPLELLKATSVRVITLLKNPNLKAATQKQEREAKLKAIITPVFDYDEVARRTLASHWNERSAAERKEFTSLLRAFLEKIYSDRIALYDGERLVFTREHIDQEFAEVESKIINRKNRENDANLVIYRLKRSNGKWKVYDAVVENISIVNNYRSQFHRVISKSSFEELKRMLRKKAE